MPHPGQSAGIRVHTRTRQTALVDLGGIFATDPRTTVVDIARSRHEVVGLSVADSARRADATLTIAQLTAENENRPSKRGRRLARWALDRSSPQPESTLESVSRAVFEWLGFESPEMQVTFTADGETDRVDFWWRDTRIVGEADGDVKYDGWLGDPVAVIRREKERDRRLHRTADGIAHWGWRDVALVSPLRESLRQAGLHPIAPEAGAQLASLRALLRPRRDHRTP